MRRGWRTLMRKHSWSCWTLCGVAGFIAACVPPSTQQANVSAEQVKAEQLKQQQLVITSQLKDQQRLANVGYELLRAAAPLCGAKAVRTSVGVQVATVYAFGNEFEDA